MKHHNIQGDRGSKEESSFNELLAGRGGRRRVLPIAPRGVLASVVAIKGGVASLIVVRSSPFLSSLIVCWCIYLGCVWKCSVVPFKL